MKKNRSPDYKKSSTLNNKKDYIIPEDTRGENEYHKRKQLKDRKKLGTRTPERSGQRTPEKSGQKTPERRGVKTNNTRNDFYDDQDNHQGYPNSPQVVKAPAFNCDWRN